MEEVNLQFLIILVPAENEHPVRSHFHQTCLTPRCKLSINFCIPSFPQTISQPPSVQTCCYVMSSLCPSWFLDILTVVISYPSPYCHQPSSHAFHQDPQFQKTLHLYRNDLPYNNCYYLNILKMLFHQLNLPQMGLENRSKERCKRMILMKITSPHFSEIHGFF